MLHFSVSYEQFFTNLSNWQPSYVRTHIRILNYVHAHIQYIMVSICLQKQTFLHTIIRTFRVVLYYQHAMK